MRRLVRQRHVMFTWFLSVNMECMQQHSTVTWDHPVWLFWLKLGWPKRSQKHHFVCLLMGYNLSSTVLLDRKQQLDFWFTFPNKLCLQRWQFVQVYWSDLLRWDTDSCFAMMHPTSMTYIEIHPLSLRNLWRGKLWHHRPEGIIERSK